MFNKEVELKVQILLVCLTMVPQIVPKFSSIKFDQFLGEIYKKKSLKHPNYGKIVLF